MNQLQVTMNPQMTFLVMMMMVFQDNIDTSNKMCVLDFGYHILHFQQKIIYLNHRSLLLSQPKYIF